MWPRTTIMRAVIQAESTYMNSITADALLDCLKHRKKWDPYWFADFWLQLEGANEMTCESLMKTYIEAVSRNPSLKYSLLTLRGLVTFVEENKMFKLKRVLQDLTQAIQKNFLTDDMQL
jgi:hypothetical protein